MEKQHRYQKMDQDFRSFDAETQESSETRVDLVKTNNDDVKRAIDSGPLVLGVWGAFSFCSLVILVLSGVLWGPDSVSGECSIMNSGTEYLALYKYHLQCTQAEVVPGSSEKAKWVLKDVPRFSSLKSCIDFYCYSHFGGSSGWYEPDTPIFGQCYAVPLGISTGCCGLVATICFLLFVTGHPNKKMRFVVSSVLVLVTLGLGLSCSILSLYHFGNQRPPSADISKEGTGPDGGGTEFEIEEYCKYTYPGSRGSYKTMTAFGFLISITSLVVWAIEVNVYQKYQREIPSGEVTEALSQHLF